MTMQKSVAVRNAELDAGETTTGTSAVLQIRTGAQPATCATASSGTLLVQLSLPSDWMSAASAGVKSLLGTWQNTAAATGTAGHYRIFDSGVTTCHFQGQVNQRVTISTNALTAANGNVLNFASTTGVAVGMVVSGTGVVAGSTVVAFTGTTVTLSLTSTAGVANTTSIQFDGDITVDNASIASGQTVTVTAYSWTAGNA